MYFLSLISCSINKLKSHILRKVLRKFYVFRFNVEKNFLLKELVGGWRPPLPLFLYGPIFICTYILYIRIYICIYAYVYVNVKKMYKKVKKL